MKFIFDSVTLKFDKAIRIKRPTNFFLTIEGLQFQFLMSFPDDMSELGDKVDLTELRFQPKSDFWPGLPTLVSVNLKLDFKSAIQQCGSPQAYAIEQSEIWDSTSLDRWHFVCSF